MRLEGRTALVTGGASGIGAAICARLAFTKAMARESARFGITVNSIAPGPIDTPLLRRTDELGEFGERIVANMTSVTQLRRLGRPEEVAAAAAFLAAEESSYVTGETLGVSGGLGMV